MALGWSVFTIFRTHYVCVLFRIAICAPYVLCIYGPVSQLFTLPGNLVIFLTLWALSVKVVSPLKRPEVYKQWHSLGTCMSLSFLSQSVQSAKLEVVGIHKPRPHTRSSSLMCQPFPLLQGRIPTTSVKVSLLPHCVPVTWAQSHLSSPSQGRGYQVWKLECLNLKSGYDL